MHTLEYRDEIGGRQRRVVFNFNGGFDGDVSISVVGGDSMEVPFDSLKMFVASYVRQRRIGALEDATPDEVLALKT